MELNFKGKIPGTDIEFDATIYSEQEYQEFKDILQYSVEDLTTKELLEGKEKRKEKATEKHEKTNQPIEKATESQINLLLKNNIEFNEDISKAEATELIGNLYKENKLKGKNTPIKQVRRIA